MKNFKLLNQSFLIILLCFLTQQTLGQFQGKMVFKTMDKERYFTIFSADAGYRYEFDEDGQQGVVIVPKDSPDLFILMPQQKMAIKSSAASPMSMSNDPLKSYEHHKTMGLLKEVGKEEINGVECTKTELWNKENPSQKMYTVWFSEKYQFPMKMINHIDGEENSDMEIRDVKSWVPDADSFKVPEGYQVMQM